MRVAAPSLPTTVTRASDRAPGTCGELAQGVLPDGTRFVVTCPIDRGTTVTLSLSPAEHLEVVGVPAGRIYLEEALRRTAELLELGPCRIAIEHATTLDVGKGMASSTADIVSGGRALARAAGVALRPAELLQLAAAIEPSDGIMFDGVVAADPRTGRLVRHWDWWPSFSVAMVVPPATFDTASAVFADQERWASEYAALLGRLDVAVAARDISAFAAVATRSGELGQAFVANDAFATLASRASALGALGVCAAHTGTVAGLLYARTRAGEAAAAEATHELAALFPSDHEVAVVSTPKPPR